MAPEIFNINNPRNIVKPPPGTCLLGYRGSIAHGMHNPDPESIDDIDIIGICLGEPRHYLGLTEWGSRGTKEVWAGRYDCVYYEIKKMVSLLLQGNPNVLSVLWMRPEHYLYRELAGDTLIQNRNLFVGKHAYNAFAGYAHAQMDKMELRDPADLRQYLALTAEAKYRGIHPNHKGEHFPAPERSSGELRDVVNYTPEKVLQGLASYLKKGENIGYMGEKRKQLVLEHGYDSKNAAHLIRLLRMCKEFLETGVLQVYRSDAEELLKIKQGKWKLVEIKSHATELFSQCKEARDKSTLPDEPMRERAEALLVNILRKHINEY